MATRLSVSPRYGGADYRFISNETVLEAATGAPLRGRWQVSQQGYGGHQPPLKKFALEKTCEG